MESDRLKEKIRRMAEALGFSAIGFARFERVPGERLKTWLNKGYQGKMAYLERNIEKRLDPSRILADVRTIICVRMDYCHHSSQNASDDTEGVVSQYAAGEDYHFVMEKRLKELLSRIQDVSPSTIGKAYVDTGPVLEKYWAAKGGLGWIGKHTNLIAKKAGSWFFLGEVLVDAEIEPDQPMADFCGSCTRCIEACPTQAIVEPYLLDGRRCISYLNIELREDIPVQLRPLLGNLIFGCDICQDVCPWNKEPAVSSYMGFGSASRVVDLKKMARLTPDEFNEVFRRTPVKRAKWRGFLRNVAVAMGNSGDDGVIPELTLLLQCGDEMVERHAAWALQQSGTEKARAALEDAGKVDVGAVERRR
jgi:epoxyqueuosine reductase